MSKNIFNKVIRICAAPKTYRLPKKSDVLIYDREGSNKLIELLFHSVRTEIVPTRNETLSVPCLLLALFSIKYNRLGRTSLGNLFFDAYIDSWISLSRPSLVATHIDNDPRFYTIKTRWRNRGIKTVAIQNGSRDVNFERCMADFIKKNDAKKLECDILAVLGSINIPIYESYIKSKFIEHGSLINNHTLKRVNAQYSTSKRVIFISQYRQNLSRTGFYSSERALLPVLDQWCRSRGFELNILGCSLHENGVGLEKEFYSEIIKDKAAYRYLKRSASFENQYCQLDDSRLVVSVDSTLGLEALARRCKTVFFVDPKTDKPQPRLGFERELLASRGIAFFISSSMRERIFSQLDSISDESSEVWLKRIKGTADQVMAIDTCSRNLLNKLKGILGRDIFDSKCHYEDRLAKRSP